jgi:hypothetical protein
MSQGLDMRFLGRKRSKIKDDIENKGDKSIRVGLFRLNKLGESALLKQKAYLRG